MDGVALDSPTVTHCEHRCAWGLTIIDKGRFGREWLTKDIDGVWRVMLYRQKNGNQVSVAIPNQAAHAVLPMRPMSEAHFSGAATAGRKRLSVGGGGAWSMCTTRPSWNVTARSCGHIHTSCWHTFAIEKLNAGTSLEGLFLLLAHHI